MEPDDVTITVVMVTVMATWGRPWAQRPDDAAYLAATCIPAAVHTAAGYSCSCAAQKFKVDKQLSQCHVGQLHLSLGFLFTVCTTSQQSNAAGCPDFTTGISIPIANCDYCLEFRVQGILCGMCLKLRSHAKFIRDHGTNIECT